MRWSPFHPDGGPCGVDRRGLTASVPVLAVPPAFVRMAVTIDSIGRAAQQTNIVRLAEGQYDQMSIWPGEATSCAAELFFFWKYT